MGTLIGLNYVAYQGILSDAAETSTHRRDATTTLAGGMYLDLMGLVWVIQFGTAVLGATKFYYLLLLIPAFGAWKLYTTIVGVTKEMSASTGTGGPVVDKDMDIKRNKRSERRPPKRG
jgi:hypothetical protein